MKKIISILLVVLLLTSCSHDKKVGKIFIPNTTIDGAFVQSNENTKYQEIDKNGNFKYYDTYWADYRCNLSSKDAMSTNTIIYGHSSYRDRPDEEKTFSNLYRYVCDENGDNSQNQGYYFLKNNPYIELTLPDGKAIYQIFAVFYANVDIDVKSETSFAEGETDNNAFYYWWVPEYDDPNQEPSKRASDLKGLIEGAQKRSEYIIEIPVTANDKILTLQTCTGRYNGHMYGMPDAEYQNYRFVIMAKYLPDVSEIPKICNTQMFVNPNPLRT